MSKNTLRNKTSQFACCLQEVWYYMPQGRLVRQDDKTRETAKLSSSMKCDSTMVAALTNEENGAFAPGAVPAVKAASEAGSKRLLQALDDEKKAVTKLKRETKEKKQSEPVLPKTPLGWGASGCSQ